MKKSFSIIILLSVITNFAIAADTRSRDNPSPPSVSGTHSSVPDDESRNDPGFILLDILIYRPLGLTATVTGAVLFAAISPLTALASIPEPHDAFDKTYKVLIRMPARYTFVRPVGDRSLASYDADYSYDPTSMQAKP